MSPIGKKRACKRRSERAYPIATSAGKRTSKRAPRAKDRGETGIRAPDRSVMMVDYTEPRRNPTVGEYGDSRLAGLFGRWILTMVQVSSERARHGSASGHERWKTLVRPKAWLGFAALPVLLGF